MQAAMPGLEELAEMIRALEQTPVVIGQLTSDLRADQVNCRLKSEEWAPLEHVCHLRDIEIEGYQVRISKMLAEPAPVFTDIDGDKLAAERDYQRQDFDEAMRNFSSARGENIARLRALTPEAFSKCATFEGSGPITFWELLGKMSGHDSEHIEQLTELRRRILALCDGTPTQGAVSP